jgi:hypothetical protein
MKTTIHPYSRALRTIATGVLSAVLLAAASVELKAQAYSAKEAIGDPNCYGYGPSNPGVSGQALFLPLIEPNGVVTSIATPNDGYNFVFSPPACFTLDPVTGGATLAGHVESTLQPGVGLDVCVKFQNCVKEVRPPSALMLELHPECYVSPYGTGTTGVNPATWCYFKGGYTGTLTGTGSWAGAVINVQPFMHDFQLGVGANGKNTQNGGSGWFTWTIAHQPNNGRVLQPSSATGGNGDFNITLCPPCTGGYIGGVDLSNIANNYLFFFANGSQDANWQGATKGFRGNVLVSGSASFRTSGGVPYAGTIYTNGSSLGQWQNIVNQNSGQAFASLNNTTLVSTAKAKLVSAIQYINGLTATPGYTSVSATSLNGLDTTDGIAKTYVINVTSGFQISSKIYIKGDAGDVFILRWDTDANPANGFQGQVKFQSGGAIVPLGGLTAANFIHVAGDMNASGGGSNPPAPYPQGPSVTGGANWNGGGFFTGYWLTTGSPDIYDSATGLYYGKTSPFSNAIFVGGWYSLTNQFSMTSGTSGIYVAPNCPPCVCTP